MGHGKSSARGSGFDPSTTHTGCAVDDCKPSTRRWKEETQKFKSILSLYSEFEAGVGYMRSQTNQSPQTKKTSEGEMKIVPLKWGGKALPPRSKVQHKQRHDYTASKQREDTDDLRLGARNETNAHKCILLVTERPLGRGCPTRSVLGASKRVLYSTWLESFRSEGSQRSNPQ